MRDVNCIEVRTEFVGFWRGNLGSERRRRLLEHLGGCAGCDRAFRGFALSAPVLHSEVLPAAEPIAERWRRPARAEPTRLAWLAAGAMATLALAATLTAYLAIASPEETLDQALSPPDTAAELGPNPLDFTVKG